MISVIISTHNAEYLEMLRKNIHQTIGVNYEIIAIQNNTQTGICEIYNRGASQAKFSNLCFVHEDVLFVNKNWGENLISILEDADAGVVGVAGSTFLPKNPAPWWISIHDIGLIKKEGILFNNIVNEAPPDNEPFGNSQPGQLTKNYVGILDGVFMAVRKTVWSQIKFDELTFNHFHFYDLDFSASVGLSFKNYVTNSISIKHFSNGTLDINWLSAAVAFNKKWRSKLPLNKGHLSNDLIQKFELIAAREFYEMCIEKKFYPVLIMKCWLYILKETGFSKEFFRLSLNYFKGLLRS